MRNGSLVRRHWYLATVIAAAVMLGVGQAVWRAYAKPSPGESALGAILCTGFLVVLAFALDAAAHGLRRFRNRWATRHITREMDRVRAAGRRSRQADPGPRDFGFTAAARRPGRRSPW